MAPTTSLNCHQPHVQAPNYFKVITQPMCFDDIRKKLEENKYGDSWDAFEHDLTLIFKNATTYNPPGALRAHACVRLLAWLACGAGLRWGSGWCGVSGPPRCMRVLVPVSAQAPAWRAVQDLNWHV